MRLYNSNEPNTELVSVTINNQTGQVANPSAPDFNRVNSMQQAVSVMTTPQPQGLSSALFIRHISPPGQSDTFVRAVVNNNGQLLVTEPNDQIYKRLVERAVGKQVLIVDPLLPLQNANYNANPQQGRSGLNPNGQNPIPHGFNPNEDLVLIRMDMNGNFVDKGYPQLNKLGFDFQRAAQMVQSNEGLPAGQKWEPFMRHRMPNGQRDTFEHLIVNPEGQLIRPNPGVEGYALLTETVQGSPLVLIQQPTVNLSGYRSQKNVDPAVNRPDNGLSL